MMPIELLVTPARSAFDGGAVAKVHVVNDAVHRFRIRHAGSSVPEAVAEQGENGRFIERRKPLDAVAVPPRCKRRIVGEPSGEIAHGPAAKVIERLRQIPMIQAEPWLDPCREQGIDQPIIEGKAGFIGGALSARQNAWPCYREAVRLDPQIAHEGDVFKIAVVVVTGDIAAVLVGDAPPGGIGVPDARPAPLVTARALDLIARG